MSVRKLASESLPNIGMEIGIFALGRIGKLALSNRRSVSTEKKKERES